MLSSNPFSRIAVIPDKQARRLHAMLDGKKSVTELCRNMGIDIKDISAALQMLLKMQRIELCDAAGQSVDITLFFPESDL